MSIHCVSLTLRAYNSQAVTSEHRTGLWRCIFNLVVVVLLVLVEYPFEASIIMGMSVRF